MGTKGLLPYTVWIEDLTHLTVNIGDLQIVLSAMIKMLNWCWFITDNDRARLVDFVVVFCWSECGIRLLHHTVRMLCDIFPAGVFWSVNFPVTLIYGALF